MTREDAIKRFRLMKKILSIPNSDAARTTEAIDMAIEALQKPIQEWDEFIFDMNEFFSRVDDGKITVMRRGRGRVTVERPAMGMETTICSYGGRRE